MKGGRMKEESESGGEQEWKTKDYKHSTVLKPNPQNKPPGVILGQTLDYLRMTMMSYCWGEP